MPEEKDWLLEVAKKFEHPATVLWRAVELKYVGKIINSYFKEPILDLGCAEGKIADLLFQGYKIIGLDNCWQLLFHNANERVYKAVVLADGCKMPFADTTFAAIFSNCVIEHIPDLKGLLQEVSRVLKDKGFFVFTVPSNQFADNLFFTRMFNGLRLKYLADWYKNKRNSMLTHYHCYDHIRWQGLLEEVRLNVVKSEYYMDTRASGVWDILAALVFVMTKLGLQKLITPRNPVISRFLKYAYHLESEADKRGSGLLVVAQKSG